MCMWCVHVVCVRGVGGGGPPHCCCSGATHCCCSGVTTLSWVTAVSPHNVHAPYPHPLLCTPCSPPPPPHHSGPSFLLPPVSRGADGTHQWGFTHPAHHCLVHSLPGQLLCLHATATMLLPTRSAAVPACCCHYDTDYQVSYCARVLLPLYWH